MLPLVLVLVLVLFGGFMAHMWWRHSMLESQHSKLIRAPARPPIPFKTMVEQYRPRPTHTLEVRSSSGGALLGATGPDGDLVLPTNGACVGPAVSGNRVGDGDGRLVNGMREGADDGGGVGLDDGSADGALVGAHVGDKEGALEGGALGSTVR